MRILVWHGWLLEGSGSNVYTARIVEAWRREGHEVLLVCQEPHPERFPFLDAAGTIGPDISATSLGTDPAAGRAVLLRPDVGDLLPVFVYDEYEDIRVKTFVDLTGEELDVYLEANVAALRRAARWHEPDVAIAGHAVPGPVIAHRALAGIPMVAKVHGSDIEYAMRPQPRYMELAREGLEGASAVAGGSRDVLDRLVGLVPSVADRVRVVAPAVDVERFRPMPRREALLRAAELLEDEPALARGRPRDLDREVAKALRGGDEDALNGLAYTYDQTAPDADAPARLRALAGHDGPLVGYLGKLIPQKGVELLIEALALLDPSPRALIVGFGTFRERLEALVLELQVGDRVTFTGRLDHRYAAPTVAALDVLVVPSVLEEAFGMVALEGAAAGALPLVARHSGLAEVAEALEAEIARPGLLSFEPGREAARNIARGISRLLAIPEDERRDLGRRLSAHVAAGWSWARTAGRLLQAGIG